MKHMALNQKNIKSNSENSQSSLKLKHFPKLMDHEEVLRKKIKFQWNEYQNAAFQAFV